MSASSENIPAFRRQGKRDHTSQLKHHTHFASGGHVKAENDDETEDRKLVKSMVGKAKIKLKEGGCVEGSTGKRRLDQYASGGKVKGKGGHKTVVNIVMPQAGDKPPMSPSPIAMPPHPPMAPPPMMPPPGAGMGPPPGAMPPRPPMMPPPGMPPRASGGRVGRASGGKIPNPISDGSAGGLGRLEKIVSYGKESDKGEGPVSPEQGEGPAGTTALEGKKVNGKP